MLTDRISIIGIWDESISFKCIHGHWSGVFMLYKSISINPYYIIFIAFYMQFKWGHRYHPDDPQYAVQYEVTFDKQICRSKTLLHLFQCTDSWILQLFFFKEKCDYRIELYLSFHGRNIVLVSKLFRGKNISFVIHNLYFCINLKTQIHHHIMYTCIIEIAIMQNWR